MKAALWVMSIVTTGLGLAMIWMLIRMAALERYAVLLAGRVKHLEQGDGLPPIVSRATSLGFSAGSPSPKA